MRRNTLNKKALYESIMKSVAKQVKKALNEDITTLSIKERQNLINKIKEIVDSCNGECEFYYTVQGGLNFEKDVDCVATEDGIEVYVDPEYPEFFEWDEITDEDLLFYYENMKD